MTDEATKATSQKLVAFYASHRAEHDATAIGGRWMPYLWYTLPEKLSALWMPYGEMLGEYAPELSNIINELTHHVHRLRAWHAVVDTLSDEDKLLASHEFIDLLGTVALGLPYAIKSRFAVAAGHLCHQANQAKDPKDWKDDFPDGNLYLHHIEPYGKPWKTFRAFINAVEPVAGAKFREASKNYRHAYNHGFASHFLIGESELVKRVAEDGGKISYQIGSTPPFTLGEVADILEIERDHCYRAYEAFQALVNEQIEAIAAFDREQAGA